MNDLLIELGARVALRAWRKLRRHQRWWQDLEADAGWGDVTRYDASRR